MIPCQYATDHNRPGQQHGGDSGSTGVSAPPGSVPVATVNPEWGLEGIMPKLKNVIWLFVVLMLSLGLTASAVGMASAQTVTGETTNDIHYQLTTNELVQQLIQVLKQILNEILGGGDSLADLLPEGCGVTTTGFSCDTSSGAASLFLGAHCEVSIFDDDVYLCSVADVVFSCDALNIPPSNPAIFLNCTAP